MSQERIFLSEQTCNVVFVSPPNNPNNPKPNPLLRLSAGSSAAVNRTDVQVISLESDWEKLVSSLQGNKITLRIQDVSSSTTI